MPDPQVISLRYAVEHDEHVRYQDPAPLRAETGDFVADLRDGELVVLLKTHCSDATEAQRLVRPFLRAWEIDVGLANGPGQLRFEFRHARVERAPVAPGGSQGGYSVAAYPRSSATTLPQSVARSDYPPPPERFRANPMVETLWLRYAGYVAGREPLLSMANFCLSYAVWTYGEGKRPRKHAAQTLRVDSAILAKIGNLAANRGDVDTARKVDDNSTFQPVTPAETEWMENALRVLIRRVGEHDPDWDDLPFIHMKEIHPRLP